MWCSNAALALREIPYFIYMKFNVDNLTKARKWGDADSTYAGDNQSEHRTSLLQ